MCPLVVKNLLSRCSLMKQKQGTFLEEFLGQKRLTRAKALPRLIQVVAFTDFGIGVLELVGGKTATVCQRLTWVHYGLKDCGQEMPPPQITRLHPLISFSNENKIFGTPYHLLMHIFLSRRHKDSIYLTLLVEGG